MCDCALPCIKSFNSLPEFKSKLYRHKIQGFHNLLLAYVFQCSILIYHLYNIHPRIIEKHIVILLLGPWHCSKSIFFKNKFIYLFIYFWLCWVSVAARGLSLVVASGATLRCGARASHCGGFSCCGARALGVQAQKLWHTGLVAPWHVGSSQTRARTCVPCIARLILNHCATREVL